MHSWQLLDCGFRVFTGQVITIFSRLFTRTLREICRKIVIFLFAVLSLTIILGTLTYFIEGKTGGFTSIALSIYWAITTLLTTGYGDTVPQTDIGRVIASVVRVLGFSLLIVPIIIVIAEIYKSLSKTFSWKN